MQPEHNPALTLKLILRHFMTITVLEEGYLIPSYPIFQTKLLSDHVCPLEMNAASIHLVLHEGLSSRGII